MKTKLYKMRLLSDIKILFLQIVDRYCSKSISPQHFGKILIQLFLENLIKFRTDRGL